MDDEHYLKSEIYELVRSDPLIFEFLQQGSLDGIWYWDMTITENEWYSERFKELLGYSGDEVPASSAWWQAHIFAEDLTLAIENLEKHLKDSSHPYDQIVRYRHKDGGTVWVRCRGLVIRDEKGRPVRMLGAHTDVTDLKLTEAKLAAANQNLRASNEELTQFAYFASHDLQAPLRRVVSYLDLLEEELQGNLQGDADHFMKRIRRGTEMMTTLIKKLLDLSRVQMAEVEKTTVDIASLVEEILAELEDEIRKEVVLTVSPIPPVNGDASLLRQVFQNLIDNAIKFRKAKEQAIIQISSDRVDGYIEIHVQDNGRGFDQAKAVEAFQPFRRLTTDVKGSGIGLAITQRIITKHNGHIKVETAPNEGCTFTLSLPDQG